MGRGTGIQDACNTSADLSDLLRRLIRIDSCNPPGREGPVAELLGEWLQAAGLEVELDRFAEGRANMVARWRGSGGEPALLLNGHLDTVPVQREQWRHDPHAAIVEGDVLHGRGSVDMKGGGAAMAMACAALARSGVRLKRDLIFAGTAGEEVDCCGAQRLAERGLGPVGALVVGEPTRLQVVTAHKGALWLEIATAGRAAHGSMPDQGRNAISGMGRIIERLQTYQPDHRPHPLLGPPTVNLGTIEGGTKVNVVADRCVLTADLRSVPGQDHADLLREVRGLAGAGAAEAGVTAQVRVIADRPPIDTPEREPLVGTALEVAGQVLGGSPEPRGVSYFSDASVLTPALGVPTLIFGPGDERLAHQVDEHTTLSAVASAARFYTALAQALG